MPRRVARGHMVLQSRRRWCMRADRLTFPLSSSQYGEGGSVLPSGSPYRCLSTRACIVAVKTGHSHRVYEKWPRGLQAAKYCLGTAHGPSVKGTFLVSCLGPCHSRSSDPRWPPTPGPLQPDFVACGDLAADIRVRTYFLNAPCRGTVLLGSFPVQREEGSGGQACWMLSGC